ncbi:thiol:disulfide interchange protein DsbD [Salmonella enterica subsp. enterica]|uniref:Thiol:disulfide interchange protein DsbD n=1 Tax=Salmonella enterica I TaxID=59201 RepID=A0A379WHM0_SALET|nr:thiol:disulfide interchange protein DsbD [Salmonella enterica subsp. enterica]
MAQRIFTLILLLCSTSAFAGLFDAPGRSQFVPADRAFVFDFQQNQHDLTLSWQVKEGYYLYRKQISITPTKADIAAVQLPAGVWHEDEFYGKSEIYRKRLNVPVTVNQAAAGATLTITYQGCADAGFCYPPETKTVPLSEVAAAIDATPTPAVTQTSETSKPAAQLPFSALWALLIGIGIAFTPCVLPMYPLISGIVLGGRQRLSTGRALLLAFIYVQGMALTYTALGLVVAAAGLQFQAALQHPYVLIGLAIVFTLLALSMFGLFTLQLPSSLQTRLTLMSNRQQGGSPGGVFVMGAIAGLICSPCTTAPLSAILLYIAQSGNMWLGGGTLYLYALGMGLPLMLVTVFGNRLLPKSGPWMAHVKTAFGFVILALPVFLLERIIGEAWVYVCGRCWASLSLVGPLSPAFRPDERGCVSYRLSCWRQRSLACGLYRIGRSDRHPRKLQRTSISRLFLPWTNSIRRWRRPKANPLCWISTPTGAWPVKSLKSIPSAIRGSSRRSATRCSCRLTSPLTMRRTPRC